MDSRGVPKESAKDIPSQEPEPKLAKGKKGREKKYNSPEDWPYTGAANEVQPYFCPTISNCKWGYNLYFLPSHILGHPNSMVDQKSACSAGDPGSISESGRSPGEGNGNPLQYSCIENPVDRGAWQVPGRQSVGSQELDTT